MKNLFYSIVLLFPLVSISQDLPTIIPPSPEATSLAKFTEIPVGHYTGLPTINVPIYEINLDGLTVPIGLSYHARGIKVEEIASRVGIGWALNAGGAITRQIRGKNDFLGTYSYFNGSFYGDFESNSSTRQNVYTAGINDELDLIPDQFSFNFAGYSGKFIFDQQTKEPILQSYDDLRIERIGTNDSSLHFIISTKDGFQFYFGNPEITNTTREAKSKDLINTPHVLTTNVTTSTSSANTVNTWHLIDIVSPNGKKIHFNYEIENSEFYRRSYDQKSSGGIISSHFSRITQEQYQIKEIVFDKGKVKFIKDINNERDDLKGGYVLNSIEIENNYQRVKKYNFNYSYSNPSNTNDGNINYYLFNDTEARTKLFLDSIESVDNNNISGLYRGFEYTNKNLVPNRFSNSQDLWGYYNGENNGSFLTDFGYGSQSVSREVDTIKAQTGLIKKMIYPTGGYTNYTFEANKAIIPDYFKDLYYANPNPAGQNKSAYLSKSTITLVSSTSQKNTYESSSFDVLSTDVGPINVQVYLNGNAVNCELDQGGNQNSSCNYVFSVVDSNGQVVYVNGTPLLLYKAHNSVSYDMAIEPLQTGNYKIRAEVYGANDDPNDRDNSFIVTLNWGSIINSNQPDLIYSGGYRIQKIENYSADNGTITRTYDYLKPDGSSSGLVFSLPSYYYIEDTLTLSNGVVVPRINTQYGARPGSPLSYEQGNHVGYSHVTEYIDSGNLQGKGGKTEYEFTAFPDGGKFYKFPYTLAVNNEWLRGKPILIEYYKKGENSSNDFDIVKKEEFTYKYADSFSFGDLTDPYNLRFEPDNVIPSMNYIKNRLKFYRPLIKFKIDNNDGSTAGPNNYKVYYLTSGVQKLFEKKKTIYNTNGTLFISTKYNYDYDNHYQLAGSEILNSHGDVLKTENDYSIIDNSNTFHILINKTTSYKGSTKLSEQNTIYSSLAPFLPQKIQTSKGTNSLEDKIVYHDYDNKGNPKEVSKKDGTHIVYIWGYHKSQPIAKIENATYAQVQSQVANLQILSNSDNDRTIGALGNEGTLRAALESLRNSLPNAQVTTFTYDPLIGVTSITDPRGQTIYYDYDNFNRLKNVKDKDGNILSENEYNYKN
ncbi:RHS repeat domain-containing protein [Polaribacter porphyrae]|nr:RHS repeat domain-containing protein [Polaribacter porphyrae]